MASSLSHILLCDENTDSLVESEHSFVNDCNGNSQLRNFASCVEWQFGIWFCVFEPLPRSARDARAKQIKKWVKIMKWKDWPMKMAQSKIQTEKSSRQRRQRLTNGHMRARRRQRRQPKRKQNNGREEKRWQKKKSDLLSFYGAINLMKHTMWKHRAEASRAVPIRIVCAIEEAIYGVIWRRQTYSGESETRHDICEPKANWVIFFFSSVELTCGRHFRFRSERCAKTKTKKKKNDFRRKQAEKSGGSIIVVFGERKTR